MRRFHLLTVPCFVVASCLSLCERKQVIAQNNALQSKATDRSGWLRDTALNPIIQFASEYRAAKDNNDSNGQAAAKDKLRGLVKQQFKEMEAARQDEVAALEKRLENLRSLLRVRADRADEIIDKRVDQLLGLPSGLEWNIDSPELNEGRTLPLLPSSSKKLEENKVRERYSKMKADYGTIGVGMAGVYQQQNLAEKKLKQAEEDQVRLQAQREELTKVTGDLDQDSANARRYNERVANLQAVLEKNAAEIELQRSLLQQSTKQVRSGEATMREYEKRIAELEGMLFLIDGGFSQK